MEEFDTIVLSVAQDKVVTFAMPIPHHTNLMM